MCVLGQNADCLSVTDKAATHNLAMELLNPYPPLFPSVFIKFISLIPTFSLPLFISVPYDPG